MSTRIDLPVSNGELEEFRHSHSRRTRPVTWALIGAVALPILAWAAHAPANETTRDDKRAGNSFRSHVRIWSTAMVQAAKDHKSDSKDVGRRARMGDDSLGIEFDTWDNNAELYDKVEMATSNLDSSYRNLQSGQNWGASVIPGGGGPINPVTANMSKIVAKFDSLNAKSDGKLLSALCDNGINANLNRRTWSSGNHWTRNDSPATDRIQIAGATHFGRGWVGVTNSFPGVGPQRSSLWVNLNHENSSVPAINREFAAPGAYGFEDIDFDGLQAGGWTVSLMRREGGDPLDTWSFTVPDPPPVQPGPGGTVQFSDTTQAVTKFPNDTFTYPLLQDFQIVIENGAVVDAYVLFWANQDGSGGFSQFNLFPLPPGGLPIDDKNAVHFDQNTGLSSDFFKLQTPDGVDAFQIRGEPFNVTLTFEDDPRKAPSGPFNSPWRLQGSGSAGTIEAVTGQSFTADWTGGGGGGPGGTISLTHR